MHILNTITVHRFSTIKTLKSAIEHAQPGDKIILEPGNYKEFVTIDKPVTIVGNGDKKHVIFLGTIKTTADITLENITFDGNFTKKYFFALHINEGKTIVTNCHFMQMNFYGIYIDNGASAEVKNSEFTHVSKGIEATEDAFVLVEDSKFFMNQSNGMIISKNAKGIIRRCEFEKIEYPSIYLSESNDTTVQDCIIHSGNSLAIEVEKANAAFINCEVFENKENQFLITEKSNVKIKGCTIHSTQDSTHGIYAVESTVEIENSTLKNHLLPQIVAENSTLSLKKSKIFDSPANAIRLLGGNHATIDGCEIFNHQTLQICIENDSFLAIHHSAIYDGKHHGIEFRNSQGMIEHCNIYHNDEIQLTITDSSEVTINHTHFYNPESSESNGCYVDNSSKLLMNNCEMKGHGQPQIYAENATLALKNSKFFASPANAIRLLNSCQAAIDECEFFNRKNVQIFVETDSFLAIHHSAIYDGEDSAIYFEKAQGIVEYCDIYQNSREQLNICDGSEVTVNYTHIYNPKTGANGCSINASKLLLNHCKIHGHHWPQIYAEKATLSLKKSKLFDSSSNAIRLLNDSHATIDECEFFNHEFIQISVETGSFAAIQNSVIYDGKQSAIEFEKAQGVVEYCKIYQHPIKQLALLDDSEVTVNYTRIYNPKPEANGCYLNSSKLQMNGCEIIGHDFPQIYAEKSTLSLKESKLFDSTSNAIRLLEDCHATIEDCEIFNHKNLQISVETGSFVAIHNSAIFDGEGSAIHFEDAQGIIKYCNIYQNSFRQLNICDGSEVTVNHTHIYNPKPEASGCFVNNFSTLFMNDCEIEGHEKPQIYIEQSMLELKSSKIHDGTGNGIRLLNEAEGIIEDCDIYQHNDYPQISVENFSNILLQQSKIHSNNSSGVLFEKAHGVIKDCVIYKNRWRQIDVAIESEVEIVNTTIYHGKEETNGLVVTNASTAEIANCIFSDHDFLQILVNETSKFYLKDSKIINGRDDISCGIRIIDASGSIEQCEFHHNGESPQIAIEHQSEVTVRDCQIHSGKGIGILILCAKGIIKNCNIYNNAFTQLEIDDNAFAEVSNCRIYDGYTHGIRVSNRSRAYFQDVLIYDHYGEVAQVVIKKEANPVFQRCKIFNGSGDGFFILEKGLGLIEDCLIYNNDNYNFCIVQSSEPILRRNHIYHGRIGVYIDEANPIIENCTITDHSDANIFFDDDNCNLVN